MYKCIGEFKHHAETARKGGWNPTQHQRHGMPIGIDIDRYVWLQEIWGMLRSTVIAAPTDDI